jgi:PKD repeat protein
MRRRFAVGLVLTLCFALAVAAPLSAQDFKTKPLSERIVSTGEIEFVKGEILVKYKEAAPQREMTQAFDVLGLELLSSHFGGVRKFSVPEDKTEREMIDLLRNDPNVEYAELNTICRAHMVPNDPYYDPYQWHFPNVNCPTAWDIATGNGVVVAILDSGVAYENYPIPSYELNTVASGVTQYMQCPDLAGTSFTAGYDFVNNDTHPNDNNAHGTHVAGTIAQTTNNSYGVAGMAFDCTIMPIKILDYTGSGTAQDLADGLYWAADHGAQVINMSLGWPPGYNPGSTVHNAIQYAYNAGVVLCASSGNAGVSPVSYPAAYSEVVAVGATRYDNQRTSYSQYGSALEIMAPGGDIFVDQNGDGYGDGVLQQTFTGYDPGPPESKADPTDFGYWFYEGTSMACPHTVALVAMMISNGQTGVENIRTILHETALDLGSPGWDQYYGYGRIDAYAALNYGGTPPVADFVGNPTSGCAPLTVNFTDLSTGEIETWDWDFGDGSPHSGAQNPSHQYASAGDYTVTLTVTGPYGSDSEVKTNYIHVDEAPTAAFTGTPTSGCAPLEVDFTDQSTGDITTWDWDFGDGSPHSGAQNPAHEYTAAGDYTVTLTVTGPCGSDAEVKTNYISVGETLIAEFSGTPTSGCAPLTVDFTDESTGDITTWDWDFGDGSPHSGEQNPSHQYAAGGDYTVTLTITGACGSDSETKTNYIQVDEAPTAEFYGSPLSGNAPLTVNFYDQSTGDVTSWDWDFGDGTPHSGDQNPVHEYTAAGLYTVSLTVTGPCGSDAEVKTDYVEVTEPGGDYATLPYTTGFESGELDQYWFTQVTADGRVQVLSSYTPHSGVYHLVMDDATSGGYSMTEAWLRVNLAGESNVDLGFWWKEFGDETHSLDGVYFSDDGGANFVKVQDLNGSSYPNQTWTEFDLNIDELAAAHGLSFTGTFVIKFQQYDNYPVPTDGFAFDDVSVAAGGVAPPVAGFSGDPTSGCAPLTVSFTDESTGQIDTWDWDFGDGTPHSAEQNPAHEYADPGDYTVSLTVTGPGGSDTETKTDYIHVAGPPVADFVGDPRSGPAPLTVRFTDQSTGIIDAWRWDFGDGSPYSDEQNPVHEYTSEGTYTVTLTVKGQCGGDEEMKVDYITVTGAPVAIGEVNSFDHDQADGDTWYAADLHGDYRKPVVIAKSLSTYDAEPAHIRVRNVGPSDFEWQIEEWEYLDGAHGTETISFIVVEAGRHTLEDGTILEAGAASVNNNWATISFSQPFGSTPTLLTAVNTTNDPIACVTRTRNLGTSGFQVKVQEEEAQHQSHGYETIAWVAIEQGTGTNNGMSFHAGRTPNSVTHRWYGVELLGFEVPPIFLCHDDTYNGGNTCAARWTKLDNRLVQVKIEEEQSRDLEVNHISETVSFLAWAGAGFIVPAAAEAPSASMPETPEGAIGHEADAILPGEFGVSLISPNPFRTQAQFAISLPKETHLSAVVFNVAGKKVKTLKSGHAGAGTHIVRWDGTDDRGGRVAAGIYFCRVVTDKEKVTRKMIFAR